MLSSQEKKRHNHAFHTHYQHLCKIRNTAPLPIVKAHYLKNTLDFVGDRVKFEEWLPILSALKLDRSLHFIAIRSRHPGRTPLEEINTEQKARSLVHRPLIHTRYILEILMDSLMHCLCSSKVLTCLELEGLPISESYLTVLAKGVIRCTSLQNLSFHRSSIGDIGCKIVCNIVKDLPNVMSIDLSNCDITEEGAAMIAAMLQHQKLERYTESWKHSLRYRQADVDAMPGLRRITLNHNTSLGNPGLIHLIEVLKDDLWVKAIDLQNCGLNRDSVGYVLEMLQLNKTLAIVDIRGNRLIDHENLTKVMMQLASNNMNAKHEFHWIDLNQELIKQTSCRSLISKSTSSTSNKMRNLSSIASSQDIQSHLKSSLKRSQSNLEGVPWRVTLRLKKRNELHPDTGPGIPLSSLRGHNPLYVKIKAPTPILALPSTSQLHSDLEKTKEQLKNTHQLLEEEMKRRKEKEILCENLQKKLDQYRADVEAFYKERDGYLLVEKSTMACVQKTFDQFLSFMCTVKRVCIAEVIQTMKNHGMVDAADVKKLQDLFKYDTDVECSLHTHKTVHKLPKSMKSGTPDVSSSPVESNFSEAINNKISLNAKSSHSHSHVPPARNGFKISNLHIKDYSDEFENHDEVEEEEYDDEEFESSICDSSTTQLSSLSSHRSHHLINNAKQLFEKILQGNSRQNSEKEFNIKVNGVLSDKSKRKSSDGSRNTANTWSYSKSSTTAPTYSTEDDIF